MKREKKNPLWFRRDELMKLKNDFDFRGIKYWTENNCFYFHLQTAIVTSIGWVAIIVLLSVLG